VSPGPTAGVDPDDFLRRAVASGPPPTPPATQREFVVVRWSRTGAADQAVDLALETSLLPDPVYASLPR
jgi:hypothetical protein